MRGAIVLKKISYRNRYYDGALIFPYDKLSNLQELQQREYASIVIKTLINGHNIKLSPQKSLIYSMNYIGNTQIVKIDTGLDNKIFLQFPVPILFPSLQQICDWNSISQKIFEEDGIYGFYGLKDKSLIEHLLYIIKNSLVFGEDQYPTLSSKAAHIWYIIAKYQAFNNGNKRTALLSALMFLGFNQFYFDFSFYKNNKKAEEDLYNISSKIAIDQLTEKDVQNFILSHVILQFDAMDKIFQSLN